MAANGGGASDVRRGGLALANRVIVAGGGGYFGGGAGGSGSDTTPGGGGGGGSSYVSGVSNANLVTGSRAGNGEVVICAVAPVAVASAIPTTGEWAMAVLAMLLAAAGFRQLRRRRLP